MADYPQNMGAYQNDIPSDEYTSNMGADQTDPLSTTPVLAWISGAGRFETVATFTNSNLQAQIFSTPISLIQPGWDSAANGGTADNWDEVTPRIIPALLPSVWDQRDPVGAQEQSLNGQGIIELVGGLWFEVAHLIPRVLQDVGNIASTQTISCDLYNADRENPITVASITDNLGIGFTVTGVPVPPFDIPSQDSLLFTIKVLQQGDLNIDGSYTLTLSTGEEYTITITGSRIIMLPIRPEAPMREHLIWDTKILQSVDKDEQRISNRDVPRGAFNFRIKDQRRRMEMLLFDRQSKLIAVPAWHEPSFMSSAGAIGDFTVNVNTTSYANFYVGGYAVVFQDDVTFDALQIDSMDGTSLTFNSELSNNYPANTQVMPLMTAYMVQTTPTAKALVNDQTFNVTLQVHATDNDIASAAAFNTYNGKTLLDDNNLVTEGVLREAVQTKVYVLDNISGDYSHFASQQRSLRGSRKGFVTHSRQELWELRQLLHFLRGKQVSFYIPTFSKDLIPNQTLISGNSTFNMADIGYVTNADDRWSKKVFRMHLTDGTVLIRTIVDSSQISTAEEQLTVDTVWPYNIEIADIERIEFLEKVRFNTDDLQIIHRNALGEASCIVPTIEVTDDDV